MVSKSCYLTSTELQSELDSYIAVSDGIIESPESGIDFDVVARWYALSELCAEDGSKDPYLEASDRITDILLKSMRNIKMGFALTDAQQEFVKGHLREAGRLPPE